MERKVLERKVLKRRALKIKALKMKALKMLVKLSGLTLLGFNRMSSNWCSRKRWLGFSSLSMVVGLTAVCLTAVYPASVFLAGGVMTAHAAESSIIEKMTVTLKASYGEPEEIPEPVITVSGNGCSLLDYQYQKDYDKWRPGQKVRIDITVEADAGKYFPTSLSRSDCKVSGADFVSAKALDETTMQVRVNYYPIMVLGATEKAGWSGDYQEKAVWKTVEYAPGYSVILYGDNKVVKRLTTEVNNIDLSEYMEDMDKTYYYEVKAIPITSQEKKYLKEGDLVTSTDQEFDWEAGDDSDDGFSDNSGDGGSLKGNGYVMPDGSRVTNTWKKVRGTWYYFDENGNMVIGWMNYGDKWYYLTSSGQSQTGWLNDRGTWYYLGPDGDMQTGWIQPQPGKWYYLSTQGKMQTGWLQLGNVWYYLASDGLMQTGWVQDQGRWYFFESNGAMRTGWMNENGRWYYLDSNGVMAANTKVDGWVIGADGAAER